MGKSFARFAMGEVKRAARKHGYEKDIRRQWAGIEKTFATAKECVKEYEREQQRQQDAYELVEWIRNGGEPY